MNITVFCSSSSQVKESYMQLAKRFGAYMADRGHTLVYGGATGGLMDGVAQAVRECGGYIIGIIPQLIIDNGRESELPDELFIVEDMAERKNLMKEYGDIFVTLPGGYGTLDELFDVIASGMLGYHDKQIVLLNQDGYYDGLLVQIDRMYADRLGYPSKMDMFQVCSTYDELVQLIENQQDN